MSVRVICIYEIDHLVRYSYIFTLILCKENMWSEIIKNSRQLFALIFLLFFFTIDPLFGQQQNQLLTSQTQSKPNIIYQGADGQMVNGIRCATRPSSLEERLRLQEGARSWIERFGPVNRQSIIIIPVAFHIITDADGVTGDVTDQQIMAQVDTLNSGFVSSNFQFSLVQYRSHRECQLV